MKQGSKMPLRIIERQVLDSIPSGSGIVIKDDTAYIIGDDATGIYLLNLKNNKQQKIPLKGFDNNLYREPKPVKRDFECATLVSWKGIEYLLAFGSGSDTSRDSMLLVSTADFTDNKIISLEKFYDRLQVLTMTGSKAWNIEGATAVKDFLILFNRGNNLVIKFKSGDFISYLIDTNVPFPEIAFHRITLPFIHNHEARLSGACTLDSDHLLFSASVEDTPDWTKDGPVLGSFIGIYSMQDSTIAAAYLLQDETGLPLKEKIESLDILRKEPGEKLVLIAMGDNDNGNTNLFRLLLEIPVLKKLPLNE